MCSGQTQLVESAEPPTESAWWERATYQVSIGECCFWVLTFMILTMVSQSLSPKVKQVTMNQKVPPKPFTVIVQMVPGKWQPRLCQPAASLCVTHAFSRDAFQCTSEDLRFPRWHTLGDCPTPLASIHTALRGHRNEASTMHIHQCPCGLSHHAFLAFVGPPV